MCLTPPLPDVGNHPICTAKNHIKTMPSQNEGIDWPAKARVLPNQSNQVSFLTADSTPTGRGD